MFGGKARSQPFSPYSQTLARLSWKKSAWNKHFSLFVPFVYYSYKTVLCIAPGYVFIKFTIMEPHNFELSYNIEGTTEKYFSGALYLKSLGTM
jgi:hypothetical protein